MIASTINMYILIELKIKVQIYENTLLGTKYILPALNMSINCDLCVTFCEISFKRYLGEFSLLSKMHDDLLTHQLEFILHLYQICFKCEILASLTLTKHLHYGLRKVIIISFMKLRIRHEDKTGYF